MRMRRVLVAIAAAGIAAAASLLGGAFSSSPKVSPLTILAANAAGTPERQALGRLLSGLSNGDTGGNVRKLERRVARSPRDANSLTVLGLAYQQRARETGDPTFYRLSGDALHRADLAHGPAPLIMQGEASLANTRHQFG